MKLAIILSFALVLLVPSIDFAQTRRRSTTRRRPATTSSRRATPAAAATALRDGRQKVADQIKNLTRFVYVYGRLAKDLEASEALAKRNPSPEATALANRTRAGVVSSLQNISEGLDLLALQVRTTPELERFSVRLNGVSVRAAAAEAQATAGQFDQAGRTLIEIVNGLTDVLIEMN
ncbi:MAG: hypothetical protein ACR2GW_13830 [Pyrinomonadaceae bacterium]|nr:hypothetical protein [Pyrinomonadaceae bacterium]